MSDNLMPCPFCGGDAEVYTDSDDNWSHVDCFDCNFRLSEIYDPQQEAIIRTWNTRAADKLLAQRDATIADLQERDQGRINLISNQTATITELRRLLVFRDGGSHESGCSVVYGHKCNCGHYEVREYFKTKEPE